VAKDLDRGQDVEPDGVVSSLQPRRTGPGQERSSCPQGHIVRRDALTQHMPNTPEHSRQHIHIAAITGHH
jgi:hypothetical protein